MSTKTTSNRVLDDLLKGNQSAIAPVVKTNGAGHVKIDVPIADDDFPVVTHVALQFDRVRHKRYLETLRKVGAGLRRDKKRLANDMPVRTVRDVVRWLIEQAGNHQPEVS